MKQPIKNIVSIVLLVFYLAGFCGIHFIKHSCSSCNHSNILFAQSDSSESELSNCSCHSHAQACSDQKSNCSQSSYCCDYELVYIKNNPKTTISKQNKAPLSNETTLFISQNIKPFNLLLEVANTNRYAYTLLAHSETDLNLLCTYQC